MNKKRYRQLITIIIALAVPIIPFAIIGEMPGDEWLSASDGNALLFALSGCAILAVDIVLPLPSSIVGTFIGARLGMAPGFFTVLSGLTLGHVIGYWLGRLAFRRVDAQFSEAPTLIVVFLSRPVPVLAEAMAIAAGAGAMPFWHYLGICALGNSVYAAVLVSNGALLLPDALLGPGLVIPMLLPVLTWSVWRWIASRRVAETETRNE